MRIINAKNVKTCADSPVPNYTEVRIFVEEGEKIELHDTVRLEMKDGTFIEREVKLINPKSRDFKALYDREVYITRRKPMRKLITGPMGCGIIVLDTDADKLITEYGIEHEKEVKEFIEKMKKYTHITPYKELGHGSECIYDYVREGYTVPEKVIEYLKINKNFYACPGIYSHPFKRNGETLTGPYMSTDGKYLWDSNTWKYVLKYNLTLPQEFVDHIMSDAGTEFIEYAKMRIANPQDRNAPDYELITIDDGKDFEDF